MMRTLRSQLQTDTNLKIDRRVAAYQCMVEWAAQLITRFSIDDEGRTPISNIRVGSSQRSIAQFGEFMHYMPLVDREPGRDGREEPTLEPNFRDGIWLGLRLRTDEALIGTPSGVIKARTIRRIPADEMWNAAMLWSVRGIPRQLNPGGRTQRDRVGSRVDEDAAPEVSAEDLPKPDEDPPVPPPRRTPKPQDFTFRNGCSRSMDLPTSAITVDGSKTRHNANPDQTTVMSADDVLSIAFHWIQKLRQGLTSRGQRARRMRRRTY